MPGLRDTNIAAAPVAATPYPFSTSLLIPPIIMNFIMPFSLAAPALQAPLTSLYNQSSSQHASPIGPNVLPPVTSQTQMTLSQPASPPPPLSLLHAQRPGSVMTVRAAELPPALRDRIRHYVDDEGYTWQTDSSPRYHPSSGECTAYYHCSMRNSPSGCTARLHRTFTPNASTVHGYQETSHRRNEHSHPPSSSTSQRVSPHLRSAARELVKSHPPSTVYKELMQQTPSHEMGVSMQTIKHMRSRVLGDVRQDMNDEDAMMNSQFVKFVQTIPSTLVFLSHDGLAALLSNEKFTQYQMVDTTFRISNRKLLLTTLLAAAHHTSSNTVFALPAAFMLHQAEDSMTYEQFAAFLNNVTHNSNKAAATIGDYSAALFKAFDSAQRPYLGDLFHFIRANLRYARYSELFANHTCWLYL